MGRVSERTRCKKSSVSRALGSIAPDVVLECSRFDEDEVSLAQRESRADSEVSQLLDPWEWRLTVYGGFVREGNIVLEARTILYAVRYAESCDPPGRLLILSDNLALVPDLCKGRSKKCVTLLSVMRRIFASSFTAGFVLSFRCTPSE